MERTFSSPEIAKELHRRYGEKTKVVKIQMRHERAVRKYIMAIEEAHEKAANSKLSY